MKISFVAKNCFSNELCLSLKLFDMSNDHVLARKINFVAKNCFNEKIYLLLKNIKIVVNGESGEVMIVV